MGKSQMAQCLFLVDHKCMGGYNFIVASWAASRIFYYFFFLVSEEKGICAEVSPLDWIVNP